jgi:dUTP pyrophosphatase
MKLNIKRLNDSAKIPTYGSDYAAGLDLYSSVDLLIPSNTRKLVSTGISIAWNGDDEKNYYLRIAPRSGLSVKNNIDIGAGVVDYDYRGELFVCFINNGNSDYSINKGDRIAQAILEKINRFDIIQEVNNLESTNRGNGGFGSTGI